MFRRILVPVDGSVHSEYAVSYAISLARAVDAEVIVCRVIPPQKSSTSSNDARSAERYVSGVAQRFRDLDIVTKTQVRRGEPAMEIRRMAVDWEVDAIVMATRGRRRLAKLMLGSVAEAVVRDCRLPVLLVSTRRRASAEIAEAA
jgi:nucleotide-binding universal stress UspA family protein